MKKSLFLSITIILAFLPQYVRAQAAPKYYWYYYIIDRAKPVGTYTTLLYDQTGFPNIAYCGVGRSPLKFARFDGSTWQIMQVERFVSGEARMALNAKGMPSIVYGTDDYSKIMLASYDGAFWKISKVDSAMARGQAFYEKSIQVDVKGRIHICYGIDHNIRGVKFLQMNYAVFDGANAGIHSRIDSVQHNGKWNSMVLDNQGRPTAAYFATSRADLAIAYPEQNIWKVEYIDNDKFQNIQGFFPSIQCDSQNNFYISFQSHTTGKLRLAYGRSGAWKMEDITDLSGWTVFSTPNPLALDKQGNPYVAFCNFQNGDLQLAYKLQNVWHVETVDSVGQVGEYASLAINPEGMPAISYYDATHGHLRLAVASLTPPPDTDGDLIADYIETRNGTDIRDVDSDDDGLGDGEEDLNHNGLVDSNETNPLKSDTDGDGILDGVESGRVTGVTAPPGMKGTDPARFRGDADPKTKTNPFLADTDNDGLSDGAEDRNVNGRAGVDETDPNNPDTDADHLADGVEVQHNLSPLDIDSDDDGLADGDEDKNFNGVVNDDETDPRLADTDSDLLADGLELGVTKPLVDPDGAGKLLATDVAKFRADLDPATKTDPNRPDSDSDGIKDGDEDKNRNGVLEAGETNPLNADSDGDKLKDGAEILAGTNPLDRDSDDDGLTDGAEDANQNGLVEAQETNPRLFDSDEDGVGDGVEMGAATRIPDPDGSGPLRGTDGVAFIPDANPAVNSNPLKWDSDNDGLSDGEEDVNHNGAVEVGETQFSAADSDADGFSDGDEKSFKSNPLDPRSKPEITTLLKNDFSSPSLRGWTVVDEGSYAAPSDWLVYNGALIQASNIWGGADIANAQDPHRPGTYIWANGLNAVNYKVTFKLRSNDDGEMGIMFQYRDPKNYYRFSMNAAQHYRRLTKIVNGQASVVASQEFAYQLNRDYETRVIVVDGRIRIYLDGRRIFDLSDKSLPNGSIAFYCWNNAGTLFKDLLVSGQGKVTAVHDDASGNNQIAIREFALSSAYPNPAVENVTVMLQAPQPGVARYEVFDLLGRVVRVVETLSFAVGWHQIVWDGRDEKGELVPAGTYFVRVLVSPNDHSDRVLWQAIRKIVRVSHGKN